MVIRFGRARPRTTAAKHPGQDSIVKRYARLATSRWHDWGMLPSHIDLQKATARATQMRTERAILVSLGTRRCFELMCMCVLLRVADLAGAVAGYMDVV